jgi:adenylosuccinate synthase
MGATVIIGGQFGKEGKSKVAFLWGLYNGCDIAIKIGGNEVSPAEYNKRYVVEDDQSYHFEMIPPTSNSDDDVVYVFPSGSYIHIDNLIDEIKIRGLTPDKVIVDPNAWVITQENEDFDSKMEFPNGKGTAAATMERIYCVTEDGSLAKNWEALKPYIKDTKEVIGKALDADCSIIIEAPGSYGNSLLHSRNLKNFISRDTTAAAALSEAGVSPFDVDDIIMVISAIPLLVDGKDTGEFPEDMISLMRESIMVNNPNYIVLNHLDVVDPTVKNCEDLSIDQFKFVKRLEEALNVGIDFVGNGMTSMIDFEEFQDLMQKNLEN